MLSLRADRELMKAQTTQSRFLADLARQQRAAGDAGTAVLLALEALPDHAAGTNRPYVPEAELQLDGAWRDLRERLVLGGHEGAVSKAAFSPDGKRIVTASGTRRRGCGTPRPASQSASRSRATEVLCLVRRSAPTASASSPRLTTRRRGCGTPRPASQSASRSRAMSFLLAARRSAPTASASSPRLPTRRRGCGTPRPASRSASRSRAMSVDWGPSRMLCRTGDRAFQPRRQAHRHRV